MSSATLEIPYDYPRFLHDIKKKIQHAQVRASLAVNRELIQLYWEIGMAISAKQRVEGWGAKTIEKLANDLKSGLPDLKGFSLRNLHCMVQFAKEYGEKEFVQQLVAQIPWGHNIFLIQSVKDKSARAWYIRKTIENGWSRNSLRHWVESDLYGREGKAVTNFTKTLPAPQSDLANQILKDPYCFDFLTLRNEFNEKELEKGLIDHVVKFLLELGTGFSFVGKQVPLEVGGDDFYLDLLFYHYKLRCFVVVELKTTDFRPEYAGKMNFYLTAVDKLIKHVDDHPTIGLLLCKGKNKVVAEYSLNGMSKPIGVSEYAASVAEALPSIDEIEKALDH